MPADWVCRLRRCREFCWRPGLFAFAPGLAAAAGTYRVGGDCDLVGLSLTTLVEAVSLWQIWTSSAPALLRPLLAIHLVRISLIGMALALLEQPMWALGIAGLSIPKLAALLLRALEITQAGFGPMRGTSAFSICDFAGLLPRMATHSTVFAVFGGLAVVAGIIGMPQIALTVLRMWP